MTEKTSVEMFGDFLAQQKREETTRKILERDLALELKRKLQKAADQNEVAPLAGVIGELIDRVSALQVEVTNLTVLKTQNVELEAKVLNKLLTFLEEK